MIQDIAPYRYHNEFENTEPEENDRALFYSGGKLLIGNVAEIEIPSVKEISGLFPDAEFRYLFRIDEVRFFLAFRGREAEKEEASVPEKYMLAGLRDFRALKPEHLAFAAVCGAQLNNWYRDNRICGRCGAENKHSETERAIVCPECGRTIYPTISPAVIVAVIHKGKILMTKYAGRPFRHYALIAGFNEIGETIEETVHREVMEEVGVPVKKLHYYKSQPWPFSGSLLMGFFCELDGDDEDIILDRNELSEAGWFTPEEVPDDDEHIALTAEMMMVFKNGEAPGRRA